MSFKQHLKSNHFLNENLNTLQIIIPFYPPETFGLHQLSFFENAGHSV